MSTVVPVHQLRRCRLAFVLLLLLVGIARLLRLDADPPSTMPEIAVMDEGLWADSARGKVVFDDWFADDLGNPYLIAPLYTYVMTGVYEVFGVGLWQTRLPSALLDIAMCAVVGWWLWRRLGPKSALLGILGLLLCPLLDEHARFGLLESSQSFWIAASFAALFAARPGRLAGGIAGVCMACAFLTKPNTVDFGVLPLGLAFLLEWRAAGKAGEPGAHRRHLQAGGMAIVSGLAVIALIVLPIWLAHPAEWFATVRAEGGMNSYSWFEHLLRFGLLGDRERENGHHMLWALWRHGLVVTTGAWLYLLARGCGGRKGWLPGERPALVWFLTSLAVAEGSYQHVGRRQVLLVAPAVLLLVFQLAAWRRGTVASPPAAALWGFWRRSRAWFLLTLPLVMVSKPFLCNELATHLLLPRGIGAHLGHAGYFAGLLHLGAWMLLLAALARLCPSPARAIAAVVRIGPWLLLPFAALQATRLGCVPPYRTTVLAAQQQLMAHVPAGATVLGQNASVMFQRKPVWTMRRILPHMDYSTPRPNPDVFARRHPRFLLDYAEPGLREMADLTARGFHVVDKVGYLREADGTFRFNLQLWERD
jgi:4-amino-4-deoxy-L-arabinose transferase-like glycosyltransferase